MDVVPPSVDSPVGAMIAVEPIEIQAHGGRQMTERSRARSPITSVSAKSVTEPLRRSLDAVIEVVLKAQSVRPTAWLKPRLAQPTGKINGWWTILNTLHVHYGDRIEAALNQ